MLPRRAGKAPKPLQKRARRAPRRVCSTIFANSSVRQAAESNFVCFLHGALDGRHEFRIGFSNTKWLSDDFHCVAFYMRLGSEKPNKNPSKMRSGRRKNRCQQRLGFQHRLFRVWASILGGYLEPPGPSWPVCWPFFGRLETQENPRGA